MLYRLLGNLTVRCTGGFSGRFLDLCRMAGVAVRNVRPTEGGFTMEVTPEELYRVRHAARESGMAVHILRRKGLLLRLWPYHRRYGMYAGLVLFLLLQFALAGRVWQIDLLTRSRAYTEEQVRAALASQGICEGALRESIDADFAENALLTALPELKRLAISVRHGRVTVEMVDKDGTSQPEKPPSPVIPSDVVAACDGFIVSVSPYAGEAIVKPGDTVSAGQILISGVYDGNLDRTYLTAAQGEVVAQTSRETSIVLPKFREEVSLTGKEKRQRQLFFYGIKINFCLSGRNPYDKCDIINETYDCQLFGKSLPLRLTTTVIREQTTTLRPLTQEELRQEARTAVLAYEGDALSHCTIVRRTVRVTEQEDTLTLHVAYVCEEDIGLTVARSP